VKLDLGDPLIAVVQIRNYRFVRALRMAVSNQIWEASYDHIRCEIWDSISSSLGALLGRRLEEAASGS